MASISEIFDAIQCCRHGVQMPATHLLVGKHEVREIFQSLDGAFVKPMSLKSFVRDVRSCKAQFIGVTLVPVCAPSFLLAVCEPDLPTGLAWPWNRTDTAAPAPGQEGGDPPKVHDKP